MGPLVLGWLRRGWGCESAVEAPWKGLNFYLGQGLPNANGQTSHLEHLLNMQSRSRDSRELPFEAYAGGLGLHSEQQGCSLVQGPPRRCLFMSAVLLSLAFHSDHLRGIKKNRLKQGLFSGCLNQNAWACAWGLSSIESSLVSLKSHQG